MIRDKVENKGAIVIDLTGPEGNAFYLIGLAKNLARQLNYNKTDIDILMLDLKSGSYEDLIQVFDEHFGNYVILER